jgi:hypothetical protein
VFEWSDKTHGNARYLLFGEYARFFLFDERIHLLFVCLDDSDVDKDVFIDDDDDDNDS